MNAKGTGYFQTVNVVKIISMMVFLRIANNVLLLVYYVHRKILVNNVEETELEVLVNVKMDFMMTVYKLIAKNAQQNV